ncbi:nucleoside triphosphate pyrophosphohydrolase family protein [Mesotoga sp.]|uniref:nucleoside triphosphate pyrophosphohydrolase family protein n=1 Tax=Mesotoga sp. TaxID=2053577 RepID=UPI00345EB6A6
MQTDHFTKDVIRTVNKTLEPNEHLTNAALGLTGEAGEVAEIVKKAMFQGHSLNRDKIAEELGDVMFYVAYMVDTIGMTLDQIMSQNVTKRRNRYPDGFSVQKSVNRG